MMSGTAFPHLGKPFGVTLVDHTRHVREEIDRYVEEVNPNTGQCLHEFVQRKYAIRTGTDLFTLAVKAVQWHDAGKKHPLWQGACRADYVIWKEWDEAGRAGSEPQAMNLQRTGIRHEMASLQRMLHKDPTLPMVVQVAVAAHHKKLGHRYQSRWLNDVNGAFANLWSTFLSLSDEVDYTQDFEEAVRRRYTFAGPRALLQLADHRASAREDAEAHCTVADIPRYQPFSYQFPDTWTKRGPQVVINELKDEHLALLRAPTGAGKTDAALLWAQHQIDNGRADRLVIAMPTRFTANSLAINTSATLGSTGLYHSSAWYQRLLKTGDAASRARINVEQEMARLLETPVTVTTIDHLCISLTGTREDHHAIFFNLAHSCVVIDEADFYDDFTQANLVLLLRVLRLLDVRVLLMSATLPTSACRLYASPKVYEDSTHKDRIKCHLHRCPVPVLQPSDIEDLLLPALNGTPTIIYANTVQRAQAYYHWFRKRNFPRDDIILYHSRFREPDKITIEDRLRSMLGEYAWKREGQGGPQVRGVAILTQIGELSVNISADYMLSDLCPLDRLVQRLGRLSRFPKQSGSTYVVGDLHLIVPHKMTKNETVQMYPAPYGLYRKGKGWVASSALLKSATILQRNDYYSSEMFVDIVNELYMDLPDMNSHVRANQDAFRHMIGANWLLLPGEEPSPEADDMRIGSTQWKCRDIDIQRKVFVGGRPANIISDDVAGFPMTWGNWRRLELEYGINCYEYEFRSAVANGQLDEITFSLGDSGGATTQTAWFVKDDCYDDELGLSFDDPEDEDINYEQ